MLSEAWRLLWRPGEWSETHTELPRAALLLVGCGAGWLGLIVWTILLSTWWIPKEKILTSVVPVMLALPFLLALLSLAQGALVHLLASQLSGPAPAGGGVLAPRIGGAGALGYVGLIVPVLSLCLGPGWFVVGLLQYRILRSIVPPVYGLEPNSARWIAFGATAPLVVWGSASTLMFVPLFFL